MPYRRIAPHPNIGWIRVMPSTVILPSRVQCEHSAVPEPNLPMLRIIMEKYDCTVYAWVRRRLDHATATSSLPMDEPIMTQAEVFHIARPMLSALARKALLIAILR